MVSLHCVSNVVVTVNSTGTHKKLTVNELVIHAPDDELGFSRAR